MRAPRFDRALKHLSDAQDKAVKAMQHEYPVGTVITYSIGNQHIVAEIIEFGFGLRLKVRGQASGKEYWLDPRRITSSLGQ